MRCEPHGGRRSNSTTADSQHTVIFTRNEIEYCPKAHTVGERDFSAVQLGPISSLSERAARKMLQPYLDRANVAAKLPPKSGTTLEEFVQEWRSSVAVNLKGSSRRAAESHLRAHVIPKLGGLPLTEINAKAVQHFVAYLATGGRSKQMVEDVLLTLTSIAVTLSASWR
jgi:hypothetical protein